MLKKTKERLKRKFEVLTLHHIDTSVILEPESTENGKYCAKYLQLVGYKYRGILSFPVLSELFVTILKQLESRDRYDLLDLIDKTIKIRKMEFYSPDNVSELLQRIKTIDNRIDSLDREIVACAKENNAQILVTLDKNLINNKILERELGIKIRHPKDLL